MRAARRGVTRVFNGRPGEFACTCSVNDAPSEAKRTLLLPGKRRLRSGKAVKVTSSLPAGRLVGSSNANREGSKGDRDEGVAAMSHGGRRQRGSLGSTELGRSKYLDCPRTFALGSWSKTRGAI